jgi:hypothetical protein
LFASSKKNTDKTPVRVALNQHDVPSSDLIRPIQSSLSFLTHISVLFFCCSFPCVHRSHFSFGSRDYTSKLIICKPKLTVLDYNQITTPRL